MTLTPPPEPLQVKLTRILWRWAGHRPALDQLLTARLRYRHYLPVREAADVIPSFNETEVRIRQVPMGPWSTPMRDVLVVLKAALGFKSRRILELGSYRGHTTRLLAENTPPETRICAVDIDPGHGEAYAGLPIAEKITRKVGAISSSLVGGQEPYDLIFIDANHDFESVVNDSRVAFEVLASGGVVLWHDYHHQSFFHGMAGVPEALHRFSEERAIISIANSTVAIYSGAAGWETKDRLEPAEAREAKRRNH